MCKVLYMENYTQYNIYMVYKNMQKAKEYYMYIHKEIHINVVNININIYKLYVYNIYIY